MTLSCAQRSMENGLLAALPALDFERLAKDLELVSLLPGDMLYAPGQLMEYAYFPATCIVSMHYVTESGASVEIAGVGHEGVIGVALFLGGNTTSSSAVVQAAGRAWRIESRHLKCEFTRGGFLQGLLLHYTQALMTQMSQAVVCNCHHSVQQRLSRWLLLTIDRVEGDLVMTQEQIAHLLGVRREGITAATGNLQRAGLISNRRGHISVLNRKGLEATSCECYVVVKREFTRLMKYTGEAG